MCPFWGDWPKKAFNQPLRICTCTASGQKHARILKKSYRSHSQRSRQKSPLWQSLSFRYIPVPHGSHLSDKAYHFDTFQFHMVLTSLTKPIISIHSSSTWFSPLWQSLSFRYIPVPHGSHLSDKAYHFDTFQFHMVLTSLTKPIISIHSSSTWFSPLWQSLSFRYIPVPHGSHLSDKAYHFDTFQFHMVLTSLTKPIISIHSSSTWFSPLWQSLSFRYIPVPHGSHLSDKAYHFDTFQFHMVLTSLTKPIISIHSSSTWFSPLWQSLSFRYIPVPHGSHLSDKAYHFDTFQFHMVLTSLTKPIISIHSSSTWFSPLWQSLSFRYIPVPHGSHLSDKAYHFDTFQFHMVLTSLTKPIISIHSSSTWFSPLWQSLSFRYIPVPHGSHLSDKAYHFDTFQFHMVLTSLTKPIISIHSSSTWFSPLWQSLSFRYIPVPHGSHLSDKAYHFDTFQFHMVLTSLTKPIISIHSSSTWFSPLWQSLSFRYIPVPHGSHLSDKAYHFDTFQFHMVLTSLTKPIISIHSSSTWFSPLWQSLSFRYIPVPHGSHLSDKAYHFDTFQFHMVLTSLTKPIISIHSSSTWFSPLWQSLSFRYIPVPHGSHLSDKAYHFDTFQFHMVLTSLTKPIISIHSSSTWFSPLWQSLSFRYIPVPHGSHLSDKAYHFDTFQFHMVLTSLTKPIISIHSSSTWFSPLWQSLSFRYIPVPHGSHLSDKAYHFDTFQFHMVLTSLTKPIISIHSSSTWFSPLWQSLSFRYIPVPHGSHLSDKAYHFDTFQFHMVLTSLTKPIISIHSSSTWFSPLWQSLSFRYIPVPHGSHLSDKAYHFDTFQFHMVLTSLTKPIISIHSSSTWFSPLWQSLSFRYIPVPHGSHLSDKAYHFDTFQFHMVLTSLTKPIISIHSSSTWFSPLWQSLSFRYIPVPHGSHLSDKAYHFDTFQFHMVLTSLTKPIISIHSSSTWFSPLWQSRSFRYIPVPHGSHLSDKAYHFDTFQFHMVLTSLTKPIISIHSSSTWFSPLWQSLSFRYIPVPHGSHLSDKAYHFDTFQFHMVLTSLTKPIISIHSSSTWFSPLWQSLSFRYIPVPHGSHLSDKAYHFDTFQFHMVLTSLTKPIISIHSSSTWFSPLWQSLSFRYIPVPHGSHLSDKAYHFDTFQFHMVLTSLTKPIISIHSSSTWFSPLWRSLSFRYIPVPHGSHLSDKAYHFDTFQFHMVLTSLTKPIISIHSSSTWFSPLWQSLSFRYIPVPHGSHLSDKAYHFDTFQFHMVLTSLTKPIISIHSSSTWFSPLWQSLSFRHIPVPHGSHLSDKAYHFDTFQFHMVLTSLTKPIISIHSSSTWFSPLWQSLSFRYIPVPHGSHLSDKAYHFDTFQFHMVLTSLTKPIISIHSSSTWFSPLWQSRSFRYIPVPHGSHLSDKADHFDTFQFHMVLTSLTKPIISIHSSSTWFSPLWQSLSFRYIPVPHGSHLSDKAYHFDTFQFHMVLTSLTKPIISIHSSSTWFSPLWQSLSFRYIPVPHGSHLSDKAYHFDTFQFHMVLTSLTKPIISIHSSSTWFSPLWQSLSFRYIPVPHGSLHRTQDGLPDEASCVADSDVSQEIFFSSPHYSTVVAADSVFFFI